MLGGRQPGSSSGPVSGRLCVMKQHGQSECIVICSWQSSSRVPPNSLATIGNNGSSRAPQQVVAAAPQPHSRSPDTVDNSRWERVVSAPMALDTTISWALQVVSGVGGQSGVLECPVHVQNWKQRSGSALVSSQQRPAGSGPLQPHRTNPKPRT